MGSNTVKSYYLPIENSDQQLMVDIYYSLGGMNYFNYKNEPRGYYASITPVKVKQYEGYSTTEFGAFSGIKTFLLECKRKSTKAEKEAIALFTDEKRNELIDKVLSKVDLKHARLKIERELNISLPPKFEGYTKEEILMLPVQIVGISAEYKIMTLKEHLDRGSKLNQYCGPFYGEINGQPALRFETKEAYNVLSN